MNYREEYRDLFEVNADVEGESYCLAHCISADFGMFGGIVLGFNERWDMKNVLVSKHGNYQSKFMKQGALIIPVVVEDHDKTTIVYNLITKETVRDKPRYYDLSVALKLMKAHMTSLGLTRLAIPMIGCGIDRLDWKFVRIIIQEVFKDTDIEILVCMR